MQSLVVVLAVVVPASCGPFSGDVVDIGDEQSQHPDGGVLEDGFNVRVERGPGPDSAVVITATDSTGDIPTIAASIETIEVAREYGTLVVELVPPQGPEHTGGIWSGEVLVEAQGPSGDWERTLLFLSEVDPRWGQPEAVPGMVNTLGYEDSPEISPDGEWLIVGSYSPVNLSSCDYRATTAGCNINWYDAELRPSMPGADRILSDTEIAHDAPRLGYHASGTEDDWGIPPVSSYGFRRQPDGTYAEPFVIAAQNDGHPFVGGGTGFAFSNVSDSGFSSLLFFTDPPRDEPDEGAGIYRMSLVLGSNYTYASFVPYLDSFMQLLQFYAPVGVSLASCVGGPPCHETNPSIGDGKIFFDDERHGHDVWQASAVGDGYAAPTKVALSRPDRIETMPHYFGDRLYFTYVETGDELSFGISSAGKDSSDEFSVERPELSGEPFSASSGPRPGSIYVLGEPSLATVDGSTWLYFVYGVNRESGQDWNVGRVRAR